MANEIGKSNSPSTEDTSLEQASFGDRSESQKTSGPTKITDVKLAEELDKYSIEDVVELKISRFLERIGTFYPENVHELIMSKVEKPLLVQILRQVGGNQVQASKILGINRNTLRKKMKLYGLG